MLCRFSSMSINQTLRNMLPPAFRAFAKKVRDGARRCMDPWYVPSLLNDREFGVALPPELRAPAAFARRLRTRESPGFFFRPSSRDALKEAWKTLGNERCDALIHEADATVAHRFDLLGSGPVDLGAKIDWHRDFKSGERWEPVPIGQVPTVKGIKGTDIKVPWELSRFYHAPVLGVAYLLTGGEKYPGDYVAQITDWIRDNPVGHGANWLCAMEVAVRAGNWVAALPYLMNSPALSDRFLWTLGKSLLQHGRHIRTHLEGNLHLRSNHYLSDLQGLLYLGLLFPEFNDAAEWVAFGAAELQKEMAWEVYADGTDFEASTSYHRLCLELFLGPALLCKANGVKLSDAFWQRLEKMFGVIRSLANPAGRVPLIGDNDSGRLHRLAIRDDNDLMYLLPVGAVLFGNRSLRIEGVPFSEEALFYLGPEGQTAYERIQPVAPERASIALPDSGWYVLRRGDECLHVACGPNGQKFFEPAPGTPIWNGGHAHNDKLSVAYSVGTQEVLVDPGQYCYTSDPALRNHSRSTAAHNTAQVNGLEQQTLKSDYLFNIHDERARPQVTVWAPAAPAGPWFCGQHHGFAAEAGVIHRRSIAPCEGGGFRITDCFESCACEGEQRGAREIEVLLHFHLAPGLTARHVGGNRWELGTIAVLAFAAGLPLSARIDHDFVAPAYGVKRPSQVLRVSLRAAAPAEVQWELAGMAGRK